MDDIERIVQEAYDLAFATYIVDEYTQREVDITVISSIELTALENMPSVLDGFNNLLRSAS